VIHGWTVDRVKGCKRQKQLVKNRYFTYASQLDSDNSPRYSGSAELRYLRSASISYANHMPFLDNMNSNAKRALPVNYNENTICCN